MLAVFEGETQFERKKLQFLTYLVLEVEAVQHKVVEKKVSRYRSTQRDVVNKNPTKRKSLLHQLFPRIRSSISPQGESGINIFWKLSFGVGKRGSWKTQKAVRGQDWTDQNFPAGVQQALPLDLLFRGLDQPVNTLVPFIYPFNYK